MQGITISITDELVSKPYVDMTINLMEKFGVTVKRLNGLQQIFIPADQTYKSPGTVFVEGDASSASYFLAGATMTGSKMRVVGCGSASVQVCSSLAARPKLRRFKPVNRCTRAVCLIPADVVMLADDQMLVDCCEHICC